MKKFTNFNFGDSRMDREWTEVEPRMDRLSLGNIWRSEAMSANHALITQLSRNNHPISLRAIRYAAALTLFLCLGVTEVWGGTGSTFNKPYFFYYNDGGWSKCMVLYGREWNSEYDGYTPGHYTKSCNLSLVGNTEKLYYAYIDDYWNDSYNEIAVVEAENWSAERNKIGDRWGSVNHTDYIIQNYSIDYWHTYFWNGKGASSLTHCAGGAADITKYTTTLNIKVKESGAGSYSNGSTSNKPASTIKITGSYVNDDNRSTAARSDAAWSSSNSCSYASVVSGKVTVSYSSLGSNWNFDGWYIGSSRVGTGTSYEFYQTANTTVEARFTRKYSVTYNANGSTSGSVPSVSGTKYLSGTNVTLATNTGSLAKKDYALIGWNTAKDGTGTHYDLGATLTSISSDQTLYAEWLLVHVPGVYEDTYKKSLKEVSGVQYEWYSISKNGSGWFILAGEQSSSTNGSANNVAMTLPSTKAYKHQNWFTVKYESTDGSGTPPRVGEFGDLLSSSAPNIKFKETAQSLKMAVSGYSQFSFVAKDNDADKSKNKYIKVIIDGSDVTALTTSSSWSIRSFNITPSDTHIIELQGTGNAVCQFMAFAFKLPCAAYTVSRGGQTDGTFTVGSYNGSELTCTPSVSGTYTYQWKQYMSGQGVGDTINAVGSGANTNSFTPTPASAGTYYYMCRVLNVCGDKQVTSTTGTFVFSAASTYTVSASVNPSGYGTLSTSSISGVASGTSISASSNVLTVGASSITATKASSTTQWSYAFTNWTKSDGTALPSTVTADLSVYANFSRTGQSYTVTLDKQVASNTPTGSVSATYGSAMPSIGTLPSHANYTFGGFYSAVAGGGTCYYNGSGTSQQNSDFEAAGTLYAKFTQSVTLDKNGGTKNGSATATYAGTVGSISAPTYTGHTVDGYYAESGCSNKVMTAAGVLQESVTDGSSVVWTDASSKWKHAAASTLYAHWKCDKPTISFSNDVTNTVTITIPSGTTVYYTTDGSMPTGSSTEYTEPFTIDANKTIKAIAIQSGCTNSDVKSQTCTYTAPTYYNVSHSLINVTKSSGSAGANAATESVEYTAVFAAAENYILPATITVTIGGESATAGSDYTWSQRTGTVTIPGSNVTGNIAISISGVAAADNYWNEFVWKKSADYGGDGKCMDSDDANTLSTIVSGVITTNQSSATIVGGKDLKMDRPTSKGTDFVLTFDVGPADYYISSLCTYGKIEESAGAYYSWDGGENWTNIAQYSSDQTKTFDAPDATYPTSFIIKYTCTSTSSGGIYWRNAQVELAPIPAACSTPAAPTAFSAGSITSTGATFSITDAANAASYDIYYSTSNDAPTASTPATTTSTSKTKAVTGLTASTTYYAWVRSVCDDTHKSAWVAGTSFTTSAGTYTISMGAVTTNQPSGSTVGGTISASAASAAAGTTITLTATPTSADYVHTSWTVTKASSGTVEVSNNQFTMPAEAVTVTATFTRKYSIRYLEDDNTTEIDGLSPTYYLYGVGATLPTPTKSGYTFADWYSQWCVFEDDEAPEGPGYGWVDGCKVSTISTTDYGNATYLAKWTANQYSVSHSLSDVTATSGATGANAATYGTNYTAVFAAAGDYDLPDAITVTIGGSTKTADTEYTWDSETGTVEIVGTYIIGDIEITIAGEEEESCPTGGDIFKLKMDYSGSTVKVSKNSTSDWSDTYGSKSGGDVTFGNLNTSSTDPMQIKNTNGGVAYFGGNDGYIKIDLTCPLKTGDVISFTSDETTQLSFTKTASRATSPATSSKKWTVTKAFNGETTIYLWRASGSGLNLHTINIVRPVTVTFDKNGGSSVSPTSATYDGSTTSVLATPTRTDYHLVGWNTRADGNGTDLGLPGETYHLDDVTTSTATVYAKWVANSCASGTIYKFLTKTDLTNGNMAVQNALTYAKTSNYLNNLTGGYLQYYSKGTNLAISDKKNFKFSDTNSYLLLTLDCPLRATDHIKWTVANQAVAITKTSTRSTTITLATGDGDVAVPEGLVGATQLWIWQGSSSGGKISYFEVTRSSSTYNVTYNGNDKTSGSVPTDATAYDYNASVTVEDNDGSLAKTNYDDLAYWNTKDDGTGTDYAISSGTFNITDNTTLYAKWTQAVTLDKNGGTTAGSATAVWNAKGLTSFTAVVPASGYKCTGYYTTSSGAGTKVLNADGTYASSSVTDYVTSGKWSRTGAAPTLYARYEAGGALTWNLSVNTTATSLTTNSKTSAFTEISTSNMTNAAVTGLTYTGNAKSNLTGKISTPASEDASKYVSVSFQVASGYKFIPSSIKVKVQPISVAQYVKLELKDNAATPNSITYTTASAQSKGSISTVEMTNGEDVEFTGTVTLKIFCYGTAYDTDGYRLGTPITIEGEIQEACATKPSFSSMSYSQTEYTVDDDASAISIVGGTNIDTYAWKQNIVNDRSGGEDADGDSDGDSYTPPTSSAGTMYYWCEMTNTDCGITIKSAAVGVTVSASKTDATITWTDPANTPNFGGGAYTVKATVNETGWNGTAADLSITAPEGIRIYSVTSGTTDSKKWVQATFDVTTSFDRETYSSNIPFTVSHAATSTYNAISDSYDVSYTSCSGGGEGTANIPVLSATHDEGSGNAPRYWWETTGNGRILALSYGKSDCSSTSDATFTSDGFSYVASSTNQRVVFQPYVSGVTKIRVYVKSATNTLTISSIGVNASWKDQSSKYSAISTDTIIYSNDKTTGLDNKDKGYMEVEFSSALTANSYYMITFSSSSVYLYGIKLYSSSAGSGGSLTTTLAFADATVNKNQGDASFTKTASLTTENTNSLGSITYSSSNTSCATVNATTGEVTITATGSSNLSTKITATLSASGCYKGATASYTLNVSGSSCTDVAGTVTTTDLGCSGIRLTLSGYTAGATIKWYKDGDEIEGEIGTTYTATEAGSYYAVTHNDCNKASNTVVIAAKTVSAERVVEKWYIKNGRVTPDIALWSVGEGTSLSSVAWSPENATGLTASDFYLQDGVIYLKGTSPSSNDSGADIEYTLTLTVSNGCNTTEMSDASKKIKLVHQKNTDKHVLAFVVVGTANGGFTEGIPASQTTSVPLYNEIAKNFDVQATNIKSTDDEKALKEYYSQFDILCITDYPSTGDKGSHSKSYVDAIGSLIDIRPILTMEAFVAKLSNWAAKGISGTPKSPCPRQYSMDLQCKDHEIFSGTKLVKIGEGDEAMYRVTMVDKTKADYSTKDAETECSKAYDAGGYPALQGFTFDATMLADGLLPLGLIHNGESEELQVGLERQEEMSARLMVLGIQQKAMERLTDDGQKVVINALKYLMKKNAEDIADCSNTFVGGDSEEDKSTRYNWNVASHWSGNALPDCTQKVRIVAPCVIPDGQKVHVAEVIIAPDGKYNHGSDSASGSLTIAAGGALVVEGKVEAATAPNYNTKRATSASDLVIKASSTKQGALIFDNIEGETQATVEMYSPSYWVVQEGTNKKKSYWSYVGVPIQDVPVGEFFYGAVTYLYDETSGWIRKKIGTELHAFEGIGLSLPAGNMETFYGTLASTETKEITLTYSACSGENLIGNSWTAPIQIGNFTSGDFGSGATAVVSMYKTGRDDVENNPTYTTATAENDGTVSAGQWVSIPIGLPGTTGYDGPTVIPSMQAFQVNTTSETTLTLDYDKLVRDVTIATDNLTQPMSAPKRVVKKSLDAMIRVRMSGFKTRTDLWIMEDGRFSDEFDNGWEANYIECDERSPQLYAVSEIGNMSFLALPDIEGTVLGIAPSRDGNEYLFTFHYVGNEEFYLNDLKLKKSTLISDEDNYSFMYEDGDTNRFYISRTPIDAPQTPTGVDNTHSGEVKAQKFIYNDKMYIMINGRVYSAEGQIVK